MTTISQPAPPTRREFAYYSLFSALVVMGVALVVGLIWMLMPASEQVLIGAVSDFPPSDQPYRVFIDGSPLYVVSAGGELIALNPLIKKGPTRSCRVKWVPVNMRFEDPCWGAKFDVRGNYLDGPASRGLDQYPLKIKTDRVWVDLARPIPGAPRPTATP
jgi:hypothetical protein